MLLNITISQLIYTHNANTINMLLLYTHIRRTYLIMLCSSSLWSSLTGVNVEVNPCRVRTDDAMLFYGFASREAITESLNLTDIRYSA